MATPSPPPGANLAHLFRREAEETHPTHSPQWEHPSCVLCGKCQWVPPIAGPSETEAVQLRASRAVQTGSKESQGTHHRMEGTSPEPRVSTQERGSLLLASHNGVLDTNPDPLSPYFPTIVLLSDYKNNGHHCEISFSRKYWPKLKSPQILQSRDN